MDAHRIVRRVERRRFGQALLEHGDPPVERREIRPFEVVAVDRMRRGHQHAPHVAVRDEPVVCGAQQLLGPARIAVKQCDAEIER